MENSCFWLKVKCVCPGKYLHSPNMPSWHGAQLKHRDNFTFTSVKAFRTFIRAYSIFISE
jgi:hypothetical protein